MKFLFAALLLFLPVHAGTVRLTGLEEPVEVLRDRWGVPHIYARNQHDLFVAQGYMAARDRLFQIDLWRRAGTGKLAEVLGPAAVPRDRLARAVSFRGDWNREWQTYSPDAKAIASAFAEGVNAYIRGLDGKRPLEFRLAGYDPGLWTAEDCAARVAGLLMTRNAAREVQRALDVQRFGLAQVQKFLPTNPSVPIELPKGLDLADITPDILKVHNEAIAVVRFQGEQGSNNWVVDGSMTVTGKPILANDPHRPVLLPSLRKTWHLVAPGWNAIGAGEPALPGIALGHNESIAFGFTTVGIDQADLYVEKLNPQNPNQYLYRGKWQAVSVVREPIKVKGRAQPQMVDLRFTMHGPIIHEDRARNRAYALKWVGAEPGSAGYLAGLALARAKNWEEFREGVKRYAIPSENIIYADTAGNIGWHATGWTPVRKNWRGLFPLPGDTGEYEWSGFLPTAELPHLYNPAGHFVATANANILPAGYKHMLGYEFALPFRVDRVREMLAGGKKFSVADFERMQQDVTSLPARRFQNVVRRWKPERHEGLVRDLLNWDGVLRADSEAAYVYQVWLSKLPAEVFGPALGPRTDLEMLLKTLEAEPNGKALQASLDAAAAQMAGRRKWGDVHQITFRHPLNRPELNRGPISRPGDGNTVNSTSGASSGFAQTNGASYRQIIDLGDFDRSVMTNVPGESGDPESPHYSDLLSDWAAGRYHPMPFTRKAVEAATVERIELRPR